MNIKIDQNLLSHDLQTLSAISAAPAPAVTRIVFSSTDLLGRDFVKHLCIQAGLTVREDPVGNTFARWPGSDPDLAPVATGSHIDAIPTAGM
jgi:ureidoglycolate amidohydrolase